MADHRRQFWLEENPYPHIANGDTDTVLAPTLHQEQIYQLEDGKENALLSWDLLSSLVTHARVTECQKPPWKRQSEVRLLT